MLREATQNIQRVKGDFQTFFVCGGGGGPFDQTWSWGMNLKKGGDLRYFDFLRVRKQSRK